MSEPKQLLTYWLVPAEPARAFFVATIASLAARVDAVVFEPHVTIYVTGNSLEQPASLLQRILRDRAPYRLKVRSIDRSDESTKTLFVQFEPDDRLAQLSAELRQASTSRDDYQLNPHLSLIYKKMDAETKRDLIASIVLPFTEVTFDTVKAVITPAPIESRAEVEAWRVVAECGLPA